MKAIGIVFTTCTVSKHEVVNRAFERINKVTD